MLNRSLLLQAFVGALCMTSVTGCACKDVNKPHGRKGSGGEIADLGIMQPRFQKVSKAVVLIKPLKNNRVQGKVTFTKVAEGIKIVADIEGLTPGKHGFHIHEFGDCGGDDGAAAGSHFNPTHHKHGGPGNPDRHTGDLGNLVADSQGRAHYERIDKVIKLEGENSILGRSLIIHADPDDYTTQPAGASGAKIACGIIEVDRD